jgi:hypothetical protein
MITELMNQKQWINNTKIYVLCNRSIFLRFYAVSSGKWFTAFPRNVGDHPENQRRSSEDLTT